MVEIRRADTASLSNDASIIRLIAAVLVEQNEW
jgi:hypothetical protein